MARPDGPHARRSSRAGAWGQRRRARPRCATDGPPPIEPDGQLTFDKLSCVFLSGNRTRDDQPNHIRIQPRVPLEVARTWVNMCPAAVYEIAEGSETGDGAGARAAGAVELRAVRGDHRQGRPADAARGRLGARVHPDVSRSLRRQRIAGDTATVRGRPSASRSSVDSMAGGSTSSQPVIVRRAVVARERGARAARRAPRRPASPSRAISASRGRRCTCCRGRGTRARRTSSARRSPRGRQRVADARGEASS